MRDKPPGARDQSSAWRAKSPGRSDESSVERDKPSGKPGKCLGTHAEIEKSHVNSIGYSVLQKREYPIFDNKISVPPCGIEHMTMRRNKRNKVVDNDTDQNTLQAHIRERKLPILVPIIRYMW
uniref:Uncharacterized protein n=1 Tax=Candidatus Kentrum sp. LPFa TaxID=2126335 RepID=A0A450X681_9GAMM|nr:MAG: hypothetical protein BECKLPF1236C_GA0070990_1001614 [Candidatus Kentron sp. LPFa]